MDEEDDPAQINEGLSRVLSSKTFARSKRARQVLAYIVRRADGPGDESISGEAIKQDLFPHAACEDTGAVRVHVSRLRKMLDLYYAVEGRGDPVRITIPKGSYVPQFRRHRRALVEADIGARTAIPQAHQFLARHPVAIVMVMLAINAGLTLTLITLFGNSADASGLGPQP